MAIRQLDAQYVEEWDASEFPLHRQRVVATGDGEVLRGHVTVAAAIVESWCADNPVLFVALIERWIEQARAADDQAQEFRKRWEDRLSVHPRLAEALTASGPAKLSKLFGQAGLTAHQVRALELHLDGRTPTEIGLAFGVTKQTAAEHVSKALERLLALDPHAA